MKLVAVEGLTISHSLGSIASGGSFTVTSIPSVTVFAEGSAVYRGMLNFSWAGGTYSGHAASGTGSIPITAEKVRADGSFVCREGDSGTMSGTYANPSPPPATLPFSGAEVYISNAGQTKVGAK